MTLPVLSIHPAFILAAFLVYSLIHSVTASIGFKNLVYGKVGDWMKKYYRLLYSIVSVIGILPVLAMVVLIPDRVLYTIPVPWVYFTTLIQLASALFLGSSLLQTGALQFIGIPQALGREVEQELNTSGLYNYVRHPLYTFSILFIWLTPVMSQNLAWLYTAFTIYFILGALYEERKLLAIFGEDYAAYRQRTPFLIPYLF